MTTFPLHAGSSSTSAPTRLSAPRSLSGVDSTGLNSDMDSLAQHMRHCAMAQGKWPRLQRALQSTHSLVSPRIVTAAAVGTLMVVASASVVVILGWVAAL